MNLLRKLWIVALAALMAATVSCSSPTGAGSESSTAPPPPAAGSCTLGLGADAPDDEVIRAVLLAEGEFVVEQDIDALMQLWAPDSRVVDAKNTPDDDADDQNWDGKDAIRRYVRAPSFPDRRTKCSRRTWRSPSTAMRLSYTPPPISAAKSPAGDHRWELVRIATAAG